MAVTEKILGQNVFLYVTIGGETSIMVGCAKSMTTSISMKELDATCVDSGGLEQKKVGKGAVTWDIEILWRQTSAGDIATNITAYDLITAALNKTQVTIIDKNSTLASGDEVYTGVGYITSAKKTGTLDNIDTFTCSGFFNSYTPVKTA